jgi:hypothetical protein
MTHRFAAVLGSIAHRIRTASATILGLVGLRSLARFVVPALIVLFAVSAVTEVQRTASTLANRPDVTAATLEEVAAYEDDSGSVWFQFDAVMDSSSLQTAADLGTFFYLARSPIDAGQGILVRSSQGDAFFRQRVLSGRLVEDPDLVASATDAFGAIPGGLDLDRTRFLDELQAGGVPSGAQLPSDLEEVAAGNAVVATGRVIDPARFAACEGGGACDGSDARWLYLFADPAGASAIVLRSPHPPDALPVRLQGLFLRDTFDLGEVLDSDWFAAIDAEVPTTRTLRAGSAPPITVPASWVPAIAYAVLAVLLLASLIVGYPVFAVEAEPVPQRALGIGDRIDLELTGRLGREGGLGAVTLERAPGGLERMPIAELALLLWRYGLLPRDQSRREAEDRYVAEAAGDRDRLVIHERDQSALVVVARGQSDGEVRRGRLHRVSGSVPAVRFRQGGSDAYLGTRSIEERDLVAGEIAGERNGERATG